MASQTFDECWCPCRCGCKGDELNERGLCEDCERGNHEVPPDGVVPGVADLLRMHMSVANHYKTVSYERFAASCRENSEPERKRDVHTEHCCTIHGCKYRDSDCTVTSGAKKQSYPCEMCGLKEEGYYDD